MAGNIGGDAQWLVGDVFLKSVYLGASFLWPCPAIATKIFFM
jgi:hypothetical protein